MLTIYTKDWCGYCIQAKQYLTQNNFEFEEYNISNNEEARKFLMLEGHKSVPQIYYKEKLLVEGGCDKLVALSPAEIRDKINVLELKNLSL
jgi:glutaredoxin 3